MAKYLTIDNGNSSTKAAIWSGNAPVATVSARELTPIDIDHMAAQVNGKFDISVYCSVVDGSPDLLEAVERNSRKVICLDAATPSPIDLADYHTRSTLGADRIAALAGAFALHPGRELLVVDYGTAITYDRLSSAGEFLGGNIAPGIFMRLRALHQFTARLPLVDTEGEAKLWGDSTASAMHSGAVRGAVAELTYHKNQSPADTQVVLTGGGASLVMPLLDFEVTYDADLVLTGLKCIIDYNENK